MTTYDVAILGAGPGGYEAALRAHAKGLRPVLIEKKDVGGVCLNQGCIPTKVLLSIAKLLDRVKAAEALGIDVSGVSFRWPQMLKQKEAVVSGLQRSMLGQVTKAGIPLVKGTGRILPNRRIEVTTGGGQRQEISAKAIVIATGSRPKPFPKVSFDGVRILSSDDLLKLIEVPKHLVVIGGGAVGVEFASLFHSLGTEVAMVELLDRLIPLEDSDLGKRLEMSFKRRGINVHTGTQVTGIVKTDSLVTVQLDSGVKLSGEKVLVSIGRDRNTSGLGLEEVGIKLEGDAIRVNEYLETDAKGIYAIGDVTNLPQLAHVASFGADLVIDHVLDPKTKRAFPVHAIPNCIFCEPAIASVGLTLESAAKQGVEAKETRVLLSSEGKAHVEGALEGFVKLVIDARKGTVIGGHVMGGEAGEVIGAITVAVTHQLHVKDLQKTIFPHPTYQELISRAARLLME